MPDLLPCPNCGRPPRLRSRFVHAQDVFGGHSMCAFKMECRRWFGLHLCFGPHDENWIDKAAGGALGDMIAGQRWNAAVAATPWRQIPGRRDGQP